MGVTASLSEAAALRSGWKKEGKKVVFTNGVFDLIHAGHVDYLLKARSFGDILILGMNSDSSVRAIKGTKRPITPQEERAFVLSNFSMIDCVVLFDEETPLRVIEALLPDVLVKGGDWTIDTIVGREAVEQNGGSVHSIPFVHQQSTSNIIKIILDRYGQ